VGHSEQQQQQQLQQQMHCHHHHHHEEVEEPQSSNWNCVVCEQLFAENEFNAKSMREHIGAHIIRVDVSRDVCGCCGGEGCTPSIFKGQPVVACAAGFVASPTSAGWKQGPNLKDKPGCTNTPLRCTHSNCGVIIWKYGMAMHMAAKHEGPHHENFSDIGPVEQKYMEAIVKKLPRN
jgi:hypothetical protein